jgi:hypothetical protein
MKYLSTYILVSTANKINSADNNEIITNISDKFKNMIYIDLNLDKIKSYESYIHSLQSACLLNIAICRMHRYSKNVSTIPKNVRNVCNINNLAAMTPAELCDVSLLISGTYVQYVYVCT